MPLLHEPEADRGGQRLVQLSRMLQGEDVELDERQYEDREPTLSDGLSFGPNEQTSTSYADSPERLQCVVDDDRHHSTESG